MRNPEYKGIPYGSPSTRLQKPLELVDLLALCTHKLTENGHKSVVPTQSLTELREGEDTVALRAALQYHGLTSKYPASKEAASAARACAKETLLQCELACRESNEHLKLHAHENPYLIRAREICARVLGDLTPNRILNMIRSGEHGPGSTLSNSKGRVTSYYKFADLPYTVTTRAKPYLWAAISSDRRWMDYLYHQPIDRIPPLGYSDLQKEIIYLDAFTRIVETDTITFVPKNAKTERPIAVGANGNVFLQLGVKSEMERCLQRVGVDLTDQTHNQNLARLGSSLWTHPNSHCTLDLQSASDSISTELVRFLLDPMWFAFLSDLRHDSGSLDGEDIVYNKFSAMGNGYTFPLESLIFYALTCAVHELDRHSFNSDDFAIYGDDIIVRRFAVQSLVSLLSFCGFTLNEEKSFWDSPYRESCGKDYHFGKSVRPFFLKRQLTRVCDLYFVINSLNTVMNEQGRSPLYCTLIDALIENIPRHCLRLGPVDRVDDAIAVPWWFAKNHPLRLRELNNEAAKQVRGDTQSAVFLQYFWLAKNFRAKAQVAYFAHLRKIVDQKERWYDKSTIPLRVNRSVDRTVVQQRDVVELRFAYMAVPNWDNCLRRDLLYRWYIPSL